MTRVHLTQAPPHAFTPTSPQPQYLTSTNLTYTSLPYPAEPFNMTSANATMWCLAITPRNEDVQLHHSAGDAQVGCRASNVLQILSTSGFMAQKSARQSCLVVCSGLVSSSCRLGVLGLVDGPGLSSLLSESSVLAGRFPSLTEVGVSSSSSGSGLILREGVLGVGTSVPPTWVDTF